MRVCDSWPLLTMVYYKVYIWKDLQLKDKLWRQDLSSLIWSLKPARSLLALLPFPNGLGLLYTQNIVVKCGLNEQSNRTPRCSQEVSAAGLPQLEHFRVQCYTQNTVIKCGLNKDWWLSTYRNFCKCVLQLRGPGNKVRCTLISKTLAYRGSPS